MGPRSRISSTDIHLLARSDHHLPFAAVGVGIARSARMGHVSLTDQCLRLLQQSNMLYRNRTREVSQSERSMLCRFLQVSNIDRMSTTREVSKPERSISVREMHPANI